MADNNLYSSNKNNYHNLKHINVHNIYDSHPKKYFINSNFGPMFTIGKKNTKAFIVPHAGSEFVKNIFDYIFCDINIDNMNTIILLTTNHNVDGNYQLSNINNNQYYPSITTLKSDNIQSNNEHFNSEHSYLSIMPYLDQLMNLGLKKSLYIFSIGIYDKNLINDISLLINDNTLLIANTDLLHCDKCNNYDKCIKYYGNVCPDNDDAIRKYNINTINKIINSSDASSINIISHESMCGYSAIKTFIDLIKNKYKYTEYVYSSSDRINNDNINNDKISVGYAGIIYNISGKPDIKHNTYLIKIPRQIMDKYIDWSNDKTFHNINNVISNTIQKFKKKINFELQMNDVTGIFITINKNNKLRGCIGTFELINNDIIYTIIRQTIYSAFGDPRFPKIQINERSKLSYKINFLKKPFKVNMENVYNKLIINKYGIILHFGNLSATFLASVLPELGITQDNLKYTFDSILVEQLRIKAGAAKYSVPTQIELYECIEISE